MIRVSRGLRELNNRLTGTRDRLSQELGRTPTVDEIARKGSVRLGPAIEALEVGRAYNLASLDTPVGGDEGCEHLGADDPAIQRVEDRVLLEGAIRGLPERLRATIRMRYLQGLGQAEVARRLGTSQMRVARLERQALELLRAMVTGHESAPAPVPRTSGGAPRRGNGQAGNGNGGILRTVQAQR